jgi:hypothetical protein
MPHVKDICIVEMISRSAKKIFRAMLSSHIINNIKEDFAKEKSKKNDMSIYKILSTESSDSDTKSGGGGVKLQ